MKKNQSWQFAEARSKCLGKSCGKMGKNDTLPRKNKTELPGLCCTFYSIFLPKIRKKTNETILSKKPKKSLRNPIFGRFFWPKFTKIFFSQKLDSVIFWALTKLFLIGKKRAIFLSLEIPFSISFECLLPFICWVT